MGLGKTLTMIALILTQKDQEKNKEKDKNTTLTWLSRDGIQVPSWPVISYIIIWASGGWNLLNSKSTPLFIFHLLEI